MKKYIALYNGQEIKVIDVTEEHTNNDGVTFVTFTDSVGIVRTWRRSERTHAIHNSWKEAITDLVSRVQDLINVAKSEVCFQESRLRTINDLKEPTK